MKSSEKRGTRPRGTRPPGLGQPAPGSKLLYLDLQAGAAGDMLLGALLDAGAELETVKSTLGTLQVPGWDLHVEEVQRGGVRAKKAKVTVAPSDQHRNLADIRASLQALPERVRELADRTFTTLAEAEAYVHQTTVEEVHFHEVGALDAIVDVVGTCAAFVQLEPDLVGASAVPRGSGHVESEHGLLPVPAPATHEIMRRHVIPVEDDGEGETITPTGAALLAVLVDRFGGMPPMNIHRVGYGAGDRTTMLPNVVRAFVGEAVGRWVTNAHTPLKGDDLHLLVETNIDDMAPELFPYVIEQLLQAGASDAWVTPILMKKQRTAFLLSALIPGYARVRVLDALFRETTTFGCRIREVEKETLERSWVETEIDGHVVHVKLGHWDGGRITASPEYEEAARAARATGRPLRDVYDEALRQAMESQEPSR